MEKNLEKLAAVVRQFGVVGSARVSSAQARGNAKKYSYWGAVRYEIRLSKDGRVINMATERASSDRRSEAKADEDLEELMEREDRVRCQIIGGLTEDVAGDVIRQLRRSENAEIRKLISLMEFGDELGE